MKKICKKIMILIYKIYLIRLKHQKMVIKYDVTPENTAIWTICFIVLAIYLLIYSVMIILNLEIVFYKLTVLLPLLFYMPIKNIIMYVQNNYKEINLEMNNSKINFYGFLITWLPLPIIIGCATIIGIYGEIF